MKKESLYKLFVECYMIIAEVQNSTSEIREDFKKMNPSWEDIERFVDVRPSTIEYITSVNSNYKKLSELLDKINFNYKNKTPKTMSKYINIISNVHVLIVGLLCDAHVERAGIKDADDISRRYVEIDTDLVWNVQKGFNDLHMSNLDYITKESNKIK